MKTAVLLFCLVAIACGNLPPEEKPVQQSLTPGIATNGATIQWFKNTSDPLSKLFIGIDGATHAAETDALPFLPRSGGKLCNCASITPNSASAIPETLSALFGTIVSFKAKYLITSYTINYADAANIGESTGCLSIPGETPIIWKASDNWTSTVIAITCEWSP